MSCSTELPEGWYAELLGQEALVGLLAKESGIAAVGLLCDKETGRYVLRIGVEPSDSKEAKASATERVKTVRGLLKVAGFFVPDISAGDPFRVNQDGSRHISVTMLSTIFATNSITAEVVRDGVVQPKVPPKPYLVRLDELAAFDPDAGRVLCLLSTPDAETWTGLYRVNEVIEAAEGGGRKLVDKGWIGEQQRSRFTRTSNSPQAAGEAARHGVLKVQPPANPMTLEEGRAYLLVVLQAWFAERLSQFDALQHRDSDPH